VTKPLVVVVILGEPVAKARPRLSTRGGVYTPLRTRHAEDRFVSYLKAEYPYLKPYRGPCRLDVRFYLGTARRVDTDNLLKLVMDAGNKRIWCDDSQVRSIDVQTYPRSDDPRTEVAVYPIPEEDVTVGKTGRGRRAGTDNAQRAPVVGRPGAGRIPDLERRIAAFRARLRRLRAGRG
jgi:Holliday junction resolvase RusA-like endonuclease